MSPKRIVKRIGKIVLVAFAIAVLVPCIVLLGAILYCQVPAVSRFEASIADADRIVVRTGPGPSLRKKLASEDQPVLATVTNAADVAAFNRLFRFHYSVLGFGFCMCRGYPHVDWFRGDECVETAVVKHGESVVFDFGDMPLTAAAAAELRQWFEDHGIDPQKPPRLTAPDAAP